MKNFLLTQAEKIKNVANVGLNKIYHSFQWSLPTFKNTAARKVKILCVAHMGSWRFARVGERCSGWALGGTWPGSGSSRMNNIYTDEERPRWEEPCEQTQGSRASSENLA